MTTTLFANPFSEVYTSDVSGSDSSDIINFIFDNNDRYAVSNLANIDTVALDATDTFAYSSLTQATQRYLLVSVVGSVLVTTTAFDYDNATPIVGNLACQGVSAWPGMLLLSTYNVTSLTFTGVTDDTLLKIFHLEL